MQCIHTVPLHTRATHLADLHRCELPGAEQTIRWFSAFCSHSIRTGPSLLLP